MIRRALAVGLFFAFLALVLACVSTGVNYWYYATEPIKVYFGLWNICAKFPGIGVFACNSWNTPGSDLPGWLHVCQAMMVLSIVFYAIGIAIILLHLTILVHTKQLIKLAGLIFFVGGLCNLVAFAVFAAKYKKLGGPNLLSNGKLYAGFGLAVASTVFGIAAGLCCMSIKPDSYESI